MKAITVECVQFGQTTILYGIKRRSGLSDLRITACSDGSIWVSAPKGMRRKDIAHHVRQRGAWVVQQRDAILRQPRRTRRDLVSGESVPYLGANYLLKVRRSLPPGTPARCYCQAGKLVVTVSKRLRAKATIRRHVREALESWYRERAQHKLVELVGLYASRLGVQGVSVFIRDMKTRWGSSSPGGRLRFNWRIMMASRPQVEYVVAHELCHLLYNDHSRRFWRTLQRVVPDYALRRDSLRLHGALYEL